MEIRHTAIRASAGCGKTYALAHRYIHLLAHEVETDRICALTFSRKAAGEIFESIVGYLVQAAIDQRRAEKVAREIHHPELRSADFLAMLRRFVGNLHRVQTGTLDSFIVGVVKAFPAELGVPADFTVMDSKGPEAAEVLDRILDRFFAWAPTAEIRARQADFLEAFNQATLGSQEKSIETKLRRFVGSNRTLFQLMPDERRWGCRKTIWPAGKDWFADPGDTEAAADALRKSLGRRQDLNQKLQESLADFVEAACAHSLETRLPDDLLKGKAIENMLENLCDLTQGRLTITYRNKPHVFGAEDARHFHALFAHVFDIEFQRVVRKTRGLRQIMAHFEEQYDRFMRQWGALTFSDVQYLLTTENRFSRGALLSRRIGEANRLYIDYRLDNRLDHWLIDEFQDTSDLQWAALRNLIDETIQDESGEKSLFYVGDVKQAIYGWRGGNARLFQEILDAYGERIALGTMSHTNRSCQPIVDAINRMFGGLAADGISAGAAAAWNAIWKKHLCAKDRVPADGYCCLLEPLRDSGDEQADRFAVVAGILKETMPLERDLSVGILVRKGETGTALADYLRRECPGMPVALEDSSSILDNPVVGVLLSLCAVAFHPGDMLAWRHVQMSPLGAWLAAQKLDWHNLPASLLDEIHDLGFREFCRTWGRRLGGSAGLNDFGNQRLAQLMEIAAQFDAEGNTDVDSFIRHAGQYAIGDSNADGCIRIMTIHKAKGLGFDLVILPELMGELAREVTAGELVAHREGIDERRSWVLMFPPKKLYERDPVLAAEAARLKAAAEFDELCVLYVAMTRAKRAMYLVVSPDADAKTPAGLLKKYLTIGTEAAAACCPAEFGGRIICEHGSRDWYAELARRAQAQRPSLPSLPADYSKRRSLRARIRSIEPSRAEFAVRKGAWFFELEARDVLDFGSAIHALFEKVEWIEGCDPKTIVADWKSSTEYAPEVVDDVCEQFQRALTSADFRQALSRPTGAVELWREKSFEIILDDQWLSGIFDRVVIAKDTDGRAVGAAIFDYKSNRIDAAAAARTAEQYRSQMETYRRALEAILGLGRQKVACSLLFTVPGVAYRISA